MKPISVDQMISEFLKAELHSSRYRAGSLKALKMCGYNEELLEHPDIKNPVQNEKRAKVLGLCRGWPDEYLFTHFPNEAKWFTTNIPLDALKKSYRLKSDENMTDTERLIQTTAGKGLEGEIVKNIDNSLILEIRNKIENKNRLPPIILVTTGSDRKKVLIEGHSRSIAYATFQQLDFDIPAIIGIAENMNKWNYF